MQLETWHESAEHSWQQRELDQHQLDFSLNEAPIELADKLLPRSNGYTVIQLVIKFDQSVYERWRKRSTSIYCCAVNIVSALFVSNLKIDLSGRNSTWQPSMSILTLCLRGMWLPAVSKSWIVWRCLILKMLWLKNLSQDQVKHNASCKILISENVNHKDLEVCKNVVSVPLCPAAAAQATLIFSET